MSYAYKSEIEYHGQDWAEGMLVDCEHAQRTIHISALSMHTPTIRSSGAWPELYKSWLAKSQQGVKIDIWLPQPSKTWPATLGNFSTGNKLAAAGLFPHFVKSNRLLHAKTCIIDAQIVWIGSGNFTAAAAHYNHEAYLRTYSPGIAEKLIDRWESLA